MYVYVCVEMSIYVYICVPEEQLGISTGDTNRQIPSAKQFRTFFVQNRFVN